MVCCLTKFGGTETDTANALRVRQFPTAGNPPSGLDSPVALSRGTLSAVALGIGGEPPRPHCRRSYVATATLTPKHWLNFALFTPCCTSMLQLQVIPI
ncbi:hypothetical protein BV372_32995 [Nostoc sp. T09]|uniref:hypothetical protein n=1 Tax=Nostoc sp. T09 TaxID=1932621 RepID=UPI000A3ACF64|nr:hypothetical protein [Nostoc sp. T09]OUL20312.1 hypothetical protein BV372_32995 [Nostoc sp. T09]